MLLSDGTTKIFLNTKGTKREILPRLKELLDYLEKPVREPFFDWKYTEKWTTFRLTYTPILKKIEQERIKISTDQGRRLDYMKYEADMQDNYKEGRTDGEAIGLKKGETAIILKLLETISIEEVAKITDKTVEEIHELTESI